MRRHPTLLVLPVALLLAACSNDAPAEGAANTGASKPVLTDDQYRQQAINKMHDALLADVQVMGEGAKDIAAAAPSPPDRGWDATLDAAAITSMKDAWVKTRSAYEDVEGALAPLFPNVD